MKKSSGRKETRRASKRLRKRGDLTRKSTHRMRTHDGMIASKKFKRTPEGLKEV